MDRFVLTERVVEAGLKLIERAKQFDCAAVKRARAIRNGLMLALWPLCPSRRKNFASLEIGKTFKLVRGKWWITIAEKDTKTRQRPEERPVVEWLNPFIELYLKQARPILLNRSKQDTEALWISGQPGGQITAEYLSALIPQVTLKTIGVAISPHLFRTANATTAAVSVADMPHLATALLGHKNRRITEDYIRPSSLIAGDELALVLQQYGSGKCRNSSP
jgi:site-specific recombinase XerD